MKPYYEEKGITIYHGDCREILPTLEPVDLVLTDPPSVERRRQTCVLVLSKIFANQGASNARACGILQGITERFRK